MQKLPSSPSTHLGQATGVLLTALAAIGFSAKAILVKLAYQHAVDAVTLLALRMAFALPFFLLIGWWGRPASSHAKLGLFDGFVVVGLGFLGYYLASFLDFWGLQYISAGLERLILFLYPTLVVVFSWLLLRRPIKTSETIALVLSYAGIGLVFWQQVSVSQPGLWLGAGLVFGSTVAYAAYLMGSQQAIAKLGAKRFTAYAMTVASLACLAQFGLTHPLSALELPARVYGLALGMAVFSTVLPSLFLAMGIQRIGVNQAALIGSLGPVATLGLAYRVLDEVMGMEQWLGSALVLAGVLVVSVGKRG
jgi:drug/metabolite transporter (DMT)-like permease